MLSYLVFSRAARAELVVSPRAWYLAVRVAMTRMRRIMVAVRSEGSLGSLSQSSKATPMGLRVGVFHGRYKTWGTPVPL